MWVVIQVWAEHSAMLSAAHQMSVGAVEWRGDRLDSPVFHTRILELIRTSSRDNACLNTLIMSFEPTKGSVGL